MTMKVLADDHSHITDSDLVGKCQRGDKSSFRIIYQRYHHKVRATLYKICGREFLDDLQQEVFLKVWRGLPRLRNPDYFSTWLYRICWNVASDFSLKRKKDRQRQQVEMSDMTQALANHHNASYYGGNQKLLHLHYQDLIAKALQNLSLDHRAVIVLHDLEDLQQKEIAEILSIPLGTVKSRLFSARKNLRQFLEQEGVTL